MVDMDDLNEARLRLNESLGDQSKRYFDRMKLWFKMKITKEQFDLESRKHLTAKQIHLHNQFLLCLFLKCQGLAQTSFMPAPSMTDSEGATSPSERVKKAKLSKKRTHSERIGFEPVEVLEYLPTLQPLAYQPTDEPQRSCAHELFLPDQAFIMGRLMLAAWERGLDGANESAADLLVTAVQHFLKTVLTAIFSQRSGFKSQNKYFIHKMGVSLPNPWLRNTLHIATRGGPTEIVDISGKKTDGIEGAGSSEHDSIHAAKMRASVHQVEEREVLEAACGMKSRTCLPPVSAWNLLDALQVHKSAVMSQTMYSINIERLLTKLNHPTWDDEEAALARNGTGVSGSTS